MEESTVGIKQLPAAWKHVARRLLAIAENRLELLSVEVQEGRERLLHALLLAIGIGAFSMLAAVTLTAAIVLKLRTWRSPEFVLLALTVLYVAAGVFLYRRFTSLMREWQTLPASHEQLRKDRACLEKVLK